jgi:hypothetical protein
MPETPNRYIGYEGPVKWPPRSPDLNHMGL